MQLNDPFSTLQKIDNRRFAVVQLLDELQHKLNPDGSVDYGGGVRRESSSGRIVSVPPPMSGSGGGAGRPGEGGGENRNANANSTVPVEEEEEDPEKKTTAFLEHLISKSNEDLVKEVTIPRPSAIVKISSPSIISLVDDEDVSVLPASCQETSSTLFLDPTFLTNF